MPTIESISSRCSISSPFPTVAEAIQEEIERYRQSEDEVKRLKTAMVPCSLSNSIHPPILLV